MNFKKQIRNVAFLAIGTATLLFTSCSKDDSHTGSADSMKGQEVAKSEITNKEVKEEIRRLRENLPTVAIYNTTMDKYILLDINKQGQKSFSFASPGFDASFSSPNESITYANIDGSNYVIANQGSGFGASGGGTVTAGTSVLVLNYVLCFSAGEETLGGDLFDFGGTGGDGFSGAIGISGDFEALSSGNFDENSDPFQYFYGFAFYYIFDDNPSGSYQVIDFFNEVGETSLNDYAFAIVVAFQDGGGIYFSSDGTLDFADASINFSGHYVGLEGLLLGFGDDVDADNNFVEVEGFGQINCQ